MKKEIIAVVLVAIIAVGGWLVFDKVIMNPERLIVGEWQNDSLDFSYYTFNEDGTMNGKIKTLLGDPSISGTYVVNKENSTVTITYTLFSISYSDVRTFVIDGDKLTLTDASTGLVSTFTRVENGVVQTQA